MATLKANLLNNSIWKLKTNNNNKSVNNCCLRIFQWKMFFIFVLNIIPFLLTRRVVSMSIILDESPLYNEDFQPLQNHTDYLETLMTADEHDLFDLYATRTLLIIGYVILLFVVIYVCNKTYKNRPNISSLYVNTNTDAWWTTIYIFYKMYDVHIVINLCKKKQKYVHV